MCRPGACGWCRAHRTQRRSTVQERSDNLDRVLPAVTHVVGVGDLGALACDAVERCLPLVGEIPIGIRLAKGLAANVEGMEMTVLPPERRLQYVVQPIEGDAARDVDDATDRRSPGRQFERLLPDVSISRLLIAMMPMSN